MATHSGSSSPVSGSPAVSPMSPTLLSLAAGLRSFSSPAETILFESYLYKTPPLKSFIMVSYALQLQATCMCNDSLSISCIIIIVVYHLTLVALMTISISLLLQKWSKRWFVLSTLDTVSLSLVHFCNTLPGR